jgi:hypothetical protein
MQVWMHIKILVYDVVWFLTTFSTGRHISDGVQMVKVVLGIWGWYLVACGIYIIVQVTHSTSFKHACSHVLDGWRISGAVISLSTSLLVLLEDKATKANIPDPHRYCVEWRAVFKKAREEARKEAEANVPPAQEAPEAEHDIEMGNPANEALPTHPGQLPDPNSSTPSSTPAAPA